MTVKECYEITASFLPEKPEENPDMQKFMLSWCNMVLAETLIYENMYRRFNKTPVLSEPPVLVEPNEEIPYNIELVRAVFPYGMARWAFRESDDTVAESLYQSLYSIAIKENVPVFTDEVKDAYR